jgi:hypothetical protein
VKRLDHNRKINEDEKVAHRVMRLGATKRKSLIFVFWMSTSDNTNDDIFANASEFYPFPHH